MLKKYLMLVEVHEESQSVFTVVLHLFMTAANIIDLLFATKVSY